MAPVMMSPELSEIPQDRQSRLAALAQLAELMASSAQTIRLPKPGFFQVWRRLFHGWLPMCVEHILRAVPPCNK